MKKYFYFILICLTSLASIAQTVEVPGHDFNSKNHQFYFTTSIKNTGDEAVSFFIQPKDPELKDALYNDSTLIAYLLADVDTVAPKTETKINLIKKVGHLLKSIYFKNNQALFDEHIDNELYKLKFALMGMVWSQYSKMCDDYFRSAAELLLHTGYFFQTDFREVSNDEHSFGEIKVNDSWILTDFAPSMPAFMNKNSSSANGYASYKDIRKKPELLQPYEYIPWWSKEPIKINLDILELYKEKMTRKETEVNYSDYPNLESPYKMNSNFVLCPGCEIQWKQKGYYLDLRNKEDRVYYDSLHLIMQQVSKISMKPDLKEKDIIPYAKFFIYGTNAFFEDEPLEIHLSSFDDFINNKLFIRHDEHFERFMTKGSPLDTLKFIIPENGFKEGELKAPLFVINTKSKAGVIHENELFQDVNEFDVYQSKTDTTVNVVDSEKIFYLNDMSAKGNAEITTSFNPAFIPFAIGFNMIVSNKEEAKNLKVTLNSK